MTYQLDTKVVEGITYMDTPGLDDTNKKKEAAEAITNALKKNGNYKVVFVVTLEAGRVKPADVATIQLILKSATDITRYGVIFNNLSELLMEKIDKVNVVALLTQVSVRLDKVGKKPLPRIKKDNEAMKRQMEENLTTFQQRYEEMEKEKEKSHAKEKERIEEKYNTKMESMMTMLKELTDKATTNDKKFQHEIKMKELENSHKLELKMMEYLHKKEMETIKKNQPKGFLRRIASKIW